MWISARPTLWKSQLNWIALLTLPGWWQVRQWQHWGSGCYKYVCASGRLHIQVLNHTFTCYYPNQEINISLMDNGWLHTGSLVCPDCQEVCEAGAEPQEPLETGSRYVQGIDLSEAKALRPKARSNFPAPLVPSLQQDENKRLSTTTIEWISSH